MAHIEKYTASATGHMFAHYDRAHPGKESNIDSTRTSLNYNLAEKNQPLSQLDFLKKRLSEIKVLKRADVNVMCDWIVTAPENLTDGEYEKFFREVYDFLNNRYGKENVISAYVHMDETTPHVHYAFVPVVTDKKKGILKLSAKERITKSDLKSFHTDLSKRMAEVFGRDIGILNGATAQGNLTTKELKRRSENLKNFQAVPAMEETNLLTKIIGKDKVVVKRSELERLNKTVADAQIICRNGEALITQINVTKQKTKCSLEAAENKAAEIISKAENDMKARFENKEAEIRKGLALNEHNKKFFEDKWRESQNRQRELDARQKIIEQKEHDNMKAAELLDQQREDIQKREDELAYRKNSPHEYYTARINNMQLKYDKLKKKSDRQECENNSLVSDLARVVSDNKHQAEQITDLNRQLTEQNEAFAKQLEDELQKKERAATERFKKEIEIKDKLIDKLENSLRYAYKAVRDICTAVATLLCGKGDTAQYHTDFGRKATFLLEAIFNFAEKTARKEGFDKYAEDIQTRYDISPPIREELDEIDPPKPYISEMIR